MVNKVRKFFYDYHGVSAWLTATVATLIVSFTDNHFTLAGVILTVILFATFFERNRKKSEGIKHKEQQTLINNNLDFCREMVESFLKQTSKLFKLKEQERISVYLLLRDDDNHFELVARYSKHYRYGYSSGRQKYPFRRGKKGKPIGVLGKVWDEADHDGFYVDNNFPDPDKNNRTDWNSYVHEKYKITKSVIDNFRMHPREVCAHIIRGKQKKPIGVIVFESRRTNILDEKRIRNDYKKEKWDTGIGDLLELYRMNKLWHQ